MKLLLALLLTASILSGCSSQINVLNPSVNEQFKVVYDRGQPVLYSGNDAETSLTEVRLTLVDFQGQEALFEIKVENKTEDSFLFSPNNLDVRLVKKNGKELTAKVLHAQELADPEGSSLIWSGAAVVASAGAAIIPGLGSLGSLAGQLAGMGIKEGERRAGPKITITSEYLQNHTLEPETEYAGLVKVDFLKTPKEDNKVILNIQTAEDTHRFEYEVKGVR